MARGNPVNKRKKVKPKTTRKLSPTLRSALNKERRRRDPSSVIRLGEMSQKQVAALTPAQFRKMKALDPESVVRKGEISKKRQPRKRRARGPVFE